MSFSSPISRIASSPRLFSIAFLSFAFCLKFNSLSSPFTFTDQADLEAVRVFILVLVAPLSNVCIAKSVAEISSLIMSPLKPCPPSEGFFNRLTPSAKLPMIIRVFRLCFLDSACIDFSRISPDLLSNTKSISKPLSPYFLFTSLNVSMHLTGSLLVIRTIVGSLDFLALLILFI